MRLKPQDDWEENLAKLHARLRRAELLESSRAAQRELGQESLAEIVEGCAELTETTLRQIRESRNENQAVLAELSALDERLAAVERSIVFRLLKAVGLRAKTWKGKAGQAFLRSPLHPAYARMRGSPQIAHTYRRWLAGHRSEDPWRASNPGSSGAEDDETLLISVVVPAHASRPEWLRAAIDSVLHQTYTRWQLCISLDGVAAPEVEAYLTQLNSTEARVTLARGENLGISGALNLGLEAAVGEYVAFLDHDDMLEPSALAHVHAELRERPVEILYSDEDYIDEDGLAVQPNFKPGWSPQLLLACMYMGHLLVVSSPALEACGGFRSETDGAQDYDLVLRLTDKGARVAHIARVLYHWRRHSDSTALASDAKPYSHGAGREALTQSLARRGWRATVEDGERANTYQVRTHPKTAPQASLIIPTRNSTLLDGCLRALGRTVGQARRSVLVVHHLTDSAEDAQIRSVAAHHGVELMPYAGPFDFATINNRAAEQARGDVLVFVNDDVEPLAPEWLDLLCAAVNRAEVGVAGARLLYPAGTIQHAGIVLGMADGAGHLGRYLLSSTYWPWIHHSRDVMAVTGACMAIRADLFRSLDGFDAAFPVNYNDVDLCLRARQAGFRVILENAAVLIHHESLSRDPGTRRAERILFYRRWGHLIEQADPYFTPHLRHDTEDLSLAL